MAARNYLLNESAATSRTKIILHTLSFDREEGGRNPLIPRPPCPAEGGAPLKVSALLGVWYNKRKINLMNIPWYVHRYVHMKEKNIRKIVKNGRGSYYINIPIDLLRELRWKERQKLVIKKRGKGIEIVDWKK